MPEQQNIEFKQNWHDDYLKSIGGFANANGLKELVEEELKFLQLKGVTVQELQLSGRLYVIGQD